MEPKFYFGDLVVVPHGEVGEVVAIWYVEHMDKPAKWIYRLRGLERFSRTWWNESQLNRIGDTTRGKLKKPLVGDQLPLLPEMAPYEIENPC